MILIKKKKKKTLAYLLTECAKHKSMEIPLKSKDFPITFYNQYVIEMIELSSQRSRTWYTDTVIIYYAVFSSSLLYVVIHAQFFLPCIFIYFVART